MRRTRGRRSRRRTRLRGRGRSRWRSRSLRSSRSSSTRGFCRKLDSNTSPYCSNHSRPGSGRTTPAIRCAGTLTSLYDVLTAGTRRSNSSQVRAAKSITLSASPMTRRAASNARRSGMWSPSRRGYDVRPGSRRGRAIVTSGARPWGTDAGRALARVRLRLRRGRGPARTVQRRSVRAGARVGDDTPPWSACLTSIPRPYARRMPSSRRALADRGLATAAEPRPGSATVADQTAVRSAPALLAELDRLVRGEPPHPRRGVPQPQPGDRT